MLMSSRYCSSQLEHLELDVYTPCNMGLGQKDNIRGKILGECVVMTIMECVLGLHSNTHKNIESAFVVYKNQTLWCLLHKFFC
jgi:hypothetical protein